MCLYLNKDSEHLKKELIKSAKPILCYKILRKDLRSPHFSEFKWGFGLNESGRTETVPTKIECKQIDKGLHFFLQKYSDSSRNLYPYLFPHLCLYQCRYRCRYPFRGPCCLRQFKCKIQPEDIIAVNTEEIVATKATLLLEI